MPQTIHTLLTQYLSEVQGHERQKLTFQIKKRLTMKCNVFQD